MTHPLIADDGVTPTFLTARGLAISEYAYFEGVLVGLFAQLMNTTIDYAGIPFFRMNNARSRLAMLDRLLRKRRGNQYNLFFNSFGKWLRELDEERNKVVHWTTLTSHEGETTRLYLVPPNFTDSGLNRPQITLEDLYAFAQKCIYARQMLLKFIWEIGTGFPPSDAWHGIFRQPAEYPPPSTHPLYSPS